MPDHEKVWKESVPNLMEFSIHLKSWSREKTHYGFECARIALDHIYI
jgi:hypothetical protein